MSKTCRKYKNVSTEKVTKNLEIKGKVKGKW